MKFKALITTELIRFIVEPANLKNVRSCKTCPLLTHLNTGLSQFKYKKEGCSLGGQVDQMLLVLFWHSFSSTWFTFNQPILDHSISHSKFTFLLVLHKNLMTCVLFYSVLGNMAPKDVNIKPPVTTFTCVPPFAFPIVCNAQDNLLLFISYAIMNIAY